MHYMQLKLRLLAVATAVTATIPIIPVAVAAAQGAPATATTMRAVDGFTPGRAGGISTRSASSGGRSGDFTTDGWQDIMARQADNGVLKVYPNSKSFNGIYTYQPAVTINTGWSGFRWIGQGRINGDSHADVVSIDNGGVMRVYPHSGTFNGLSTLAPSSIVGYGWHINDLVALGDVTGDGYDDIVARGVGSDYAVLYEHSGVYNGVSTFKAPVNILSGVRYTVEMNLADMTLDGVLDVVYLEPADVLGVFSFMDGPLDPNGNPTGAQWTLGWGWSTLNAVTISDVDNDARPDVLGRRHNGELVAYRHSPTWDANNPLQTLQAPVLMGWGWNTNDVIS
ncbi:hypothetical protein GCM10010492_22150 [Saccharothrix mutabilis subsp. mutabilis]|uniref:VCBS repeat-containing protein n=2 Tax=Saccharothrix mutabilis TaxID=33921 RepID=A0ABP3D551_9PSEU